MPLTTILLEYSSDPVSDASPTYVTVSNGEFRYAEWWEGVSEEGAGFEPGGAVIRLVNANRKWEPLYSTNTIDTHQRFRLTLNGTLEGEWFITGISIEYPGGTEWSEVVFTCGDGSEVLALDNLPSLDPPEVQTYDDVVCHDMPWGHWRLGDMEGTTASPLTRKVWRGKGSNRRRVKIRRGTRYDKSSESIGVAGPAGVYKTVSLLQLGQPGAIVGDTDTSILSSTSGTTGGHIQIAIDDDDKLNASGELTLEAWVWSQSSSNDSVISGPEEAGTAPIFTLSFHDGSPGNVFFEVRGPGGTAYSISTAATWSDGWHHVVGVASGTTLTVYVDAEVIDTASYPGKLATPAANPILYIGRDDAATIPFAGYLDEVAIYEHGLTAERVLAHYQAGAERGFAQQTAGERIAAIVDSALWSEAGIQTAGRDVLPRMMFGQPRLEEIEETMAAEGPSTLFYFEAGAPQYRGHEWRSTAAAYNTVQATFGQAEYGELPVDDLQPEYDHETFNVAQTSREGGMLVEVEDTTASGKRGRRVLDDYTGLLLTDDAEVESLANALVAAYKDPARTVPEISVSGFDDARLSKLLSLKVGHLIRVNWSGETGARNGHTANIIKRHKTLEATEALGKNGGWLLRGVYTLSRGWDATDTGWLAGIVGRSEAGVTTNAG